jgi:hypothetical protein
MTHADFARWLDSYISAWRSYDRAAIESLFTVDATYRFFPGEAAKTGRAAIADAWLKNPDAPDSWEADYRPIAIDPDGTAVAVGESRYFGADRSTVRADYYNVFVCRFDAEGRCSEFTEYFAARPNGTPAAPIVSG